MSTVHRLQPGDRLILPPGSIARVTAGRANAQVVAASGEGGAGQHLAYVGAGALVIALPDPVRIALFAPREAEVLTGALADELTAGPLSAIGTWIRAADTAGAWIPIAAPRALFPGQPEVRTGEIVASPRDQTVWARHDLGYWPLTDGAPVVWAGPPNAEIVMTADLSAAGQLSAAVSAWTETASVRLGRILDLADTARTYALDAGVTAVNEALHETRDALAGMPPRAVAGPTKTDTGRALALALPDYGFARERVTLSETESGVTPAAMPPVFRESGVQIPAPGAAPLAAPPSENEAEAHARCLEQARMAAIQAGIGVREVAIPGNLTRDEGAPLVVTLAADGAPALGAAPIRRGKYSILEARSARPATRQVRLGGRALALTAPLDAAATAALDVPSRLLAVMMRLSAADIAAALMLGIAGVLLGTAVPIATDLLFSTVWPRGDRPGHWLLVGGLAVAALTGVAFETARSARAGRIALRFLSWLENGVWLALVRARPEGVNAPASGDMQNRLGAAGRLYQAMQGQPMRFVIDAVAMVTGGVMMAWYGGKLAWIGCAAVALLLLIWCLSLRLAMQARAAIEAISGRERALLTQAVAAITKIKATASEAFVLSRWAALASQHRTAIRKAEGIDTMIAVITAGISGLTTAGVYTLAGSVLEGGDPSVAQAAREITLGGFLAFQSALGQTLGAAGSAASIFTLWPRLAAAGARLAPLARGVPETGANDRRIQAPPLDGRVTLSQVTHRYPGSDVPSLRGIDIDIAPREYVAIAGASGSGKTTLLRVLLGLEPPASGALYFDGRDAKRLDPASIRRQLGYVGQDARLSPGSILENIQDGRALGLPEVWAAARLAGIAEDIEAMPMGLHTLAGEGGQNLSGGQRQRLMIARALLTRPRILIFDEATSALDNRTQQVVQRGLAELPVTRIVVAHRLSTIMSVDRVFVLDRGQVVEAGPPAELLRRDGPFAALARRQTIEQTEGDAA